MMITSKYREYTYNDEWKLRFKFQCVQACKNSTTILILRIGKLYVIVDLIHNPTLKVAHYTLNFMAIGLCFPIKYLLSLWFCFPRMPIIWVCNTIHGIVDWVTCILLGWRRIHKECITWIMLVSILMHNTHPYPCIWTGCQWILQKQK